MTIHAILWDFGDTLVDETWMQSPMPGVSGWAAAWRTLGIDNPDLIRRWDLGEIGRVDIAKALSAALGVSIAAITAHMEACSRNMAFFPAVMEFSARSQLPQAIVTINPDIFTEVVVPTCGLGARLIPS